MDQTFERRKKLIYDFICDEFYVQIFPVHSIFQDTSL